MRFLLPLLLTAAAAAQGAVPVARSGVAQARLVELFSSEGCSSCPPADAWMSSLREDPRLWRAFVPVIYHVTYWDYLGWPDPLGDKAYTARQRAYSAAWKRSSVYTPGFALDGEEWRGWGRSAPDAGPAAGVLEARDAGGRIVAVFSPAGDRGPYEAHAARLGFGIESKVLDGENAGRTLRHDFVALALERAAMSRGEKGWRAVIPLGAGGARAPRTGFAVWITDRDGRVVQAAGTGAP